jgi:hypothetical protein
MRTVVARPIMQLSVGRRDDEGSIWCVGVERDGVSPRRDLVEFAELIRIIDGSGVELIGTNDTSFIGEVVPSGRTPHSSPSR